MHLKRTSFSFEHFLFELFIKHPSRVTELAVELALEFWRKSSCWDSQEWMGNKVVRL